MRSAFSLLTALLAPGRVAPALAEPGAARVVADALDPAEAGAFEVSFSSALVLERTGLEVCSPSLLRGDSTPDLLPSLPDRESPDWILPADGRAPPRPTPIPESLEAPPRVAVLVLVVVVDGLADLVAGTAGGPMEVLAPPIDGRALGAAAEVTRGFVVEGVPVREVAALDVAVDASCLVGDFVGDCIGSAGASRWLGTDVLGAEIVTLYSP